MSLPYGPLLLNWYDENKRDLPWRHTHDPYKIWISEIMLQQTRVETVKDYYRRFLTLFPTVDALAQAPEEQVLKAWEGLGYYSRARSLHKAAQKVVEDGRVPDTVEGLSALPGIGPYTAGAIASIAFGRPAPAVDGNVCRVVTRLAGLRKEVTSPSVQKQLRLWVTEHMPVHRPGDYNQALMELGATLCLPLKPQCQACPLREGCDAYREGDMELLPIHEKKKPQRILSVAVCLLALESRILVVKRRQRMLNGLYTFWLWEDENRGEELEALFAQEGLPCTFERKLGQARHVFTHQIWEMEIFLFTLASSPSPELLQEKEARLVCSQSLSQLPMPSAMSKARKLALQLSLQETISRE